MKSSQLCLGLLIFLAGISDVWTQEVPPQIEFAGITLKLSPSAQRSTQNQVNLLLEDPGRFDHKVELANLYIPLISEILGENELPLDFKYLALLDDESPDSLIFWQMARKSALDLGLRVDDLIDERENIITSTRKIATYLKNNQSELDNWLLTLLTYHLSREELKAKAQNLFPNFSLESLSKLKMFYLDKNTHPDILKFIALAVAYSSREELIPRQKQELVSFQDGGNLSLEEIAGRFALPVAQLKKYNAWLKTDQVPADKAYDVIVPIPSASPTRDVKILTSPNGNFLYQTAQESFTHIVLKGETLYGISRQYDVSVGDLRKWNQLENQDVLKIGQKIQVSFQADEPDDLEELFGEDLPEAEESFSYQEHRVLKGENLYRISRQYGVSLADLRSWNQLKSDFLKIGQILRVKKIPRKKEKEPKEEEKAPESGSVGSPDKGDNPNKRPKKEKEDKRPGMGVRTLDVKTVPRELQLGDLTLRLNRGLRRKIQKDVNLLTRSESYFFRNLERIDKYMPLVAHVLDSMGLPTDFKYLPIQESVLLGDVVSSSQAVGYWQFKDASAREVGLLINSQVDERMNIYSASLGACKYLNRNNLFYHNWLISLLSYNMGFTGAKNYVKQNYPKVDFKRVKTMDLDENTHWYIRKFLAHKIVYEQELGWYPEKAVLIKYKEGTRKTLEQIAREFDCAPSEVKPHNLWLKKAKVPSDKEYVVLVPYLTR